MKQLHAIEVDIDFDMYRLAADSWRIHPTADRLVRQD
jgi:hypothetical protein